MPDTTRPLHIGFRLSIDERLRIEAAAEKAKVPVGTFCRQGALEKAMPERKGQARGSESEADFIARRTKQLYGKGKTKRAARTEARREWSAL